VNTRAFTCPGVDGSKKHVGLFRLVGKTMWEKARYKDRAKLIDKLDARVTHREPAGWDLKVHKRTGMKYHDLRYKVFLARKNGKTVSEVVKLYGVSRGFVSKWTAIGKISYHLKGLTKMSFLALPMYHGKGSPVQDRISDDVIRIRKEHPWMGSCKIRVFGKIKASSRTVDKVLRKNRLMGKFRNRKRKTYIRFERKHSMSLLQLDYKLWPGGIWSIWAIDDHSRMILGMEVTETPDTDSVIRLMNGIKDRFGTPEQILTDNGSQFKPVWKNAGHRFMIWCSENNVKHITGRVGHPETQGKIERSHLSAIDETKHVTGVNGIDPRRGVLMRWIEFYNTERPHQSLGYDVPVNVFLRDIKNMDSFLNIGVHEVDA
jgi:transposase InsO family protein